MPTAHTFCGCAVQNIVQFMGACRGVPPDHMWAGEQLMMVTEQCATSLYDMLGNLRKG